VQATSNGTPRGQALAPISLWARTLWLRRLVLRGVQAAGIGVAVALCLSLLPGQSFLVALVYSVFISLGCWFFIDGGRLLAARWVHRHEPPTLRTEGGSWPGWDWMLAVLPLGTLAGYGLGHWAASGLLGHTEPHPMNLSLQSLAPILLLAMLPGVAATYFFSSRAHLAASRTLAEQAQRMAAEQRLQLLASQLEPHMLFNTLANLQALIGVDPARAQAMLDRLILFLRATLAASRVSTHPLGQEFSRLADYLELMQIRMGARLEVRLTLPDDLASLPVPTLLLQPLVENAIKHGLEPHVLGGRIDASAERDGDRLVLRVRDTGAGLDTEPHAGAQGFGLVQVRERLATLYGAAAGLELVPAPDAEGGTLATVHLPL
jgi:signal transduction histidine kinase